MKTCIKCGKTKSLSWFSRKTDAKDGLQPKCKICSATYLSEWYEANRDKHLRQQAEYDAANRDKKNAYNRNRKANNIQVKLSCNLRTRLWLATKRNSKSGSAVRDLGCTITELKDYLEEQFQHGMNWDNYGDWHIDHIRPLASFKLENRDELLKACHYTNLQPLWAADNTSKGCKVPG